MRIGRRTDGRPTMFLCKSVFSHMTVVIASASEVLDSQIGASTMPAHQAVQVESPQMGRLRYSQGETKHFDELAAHALDERLTLSGRRHKLLRMDRPSAAANDANTGSKADAAFATQQDR